MKFLVLFPKKWAPASTNTQSLPNAGQWIGYIERILMLTFVLVGRFEGVGFLLAAKSVCLPLWRIEQSKGNLHYRVCVDWYICKFYHCHSYRNCIVTYILTPVPHFWLYNKVYGNGLQPKKFNWKKMFYLNPDEYLRSK